MRVLGIETSCDETGVAVYDTDRGLLAHALFSQIALHAEYGGVVPELASRDHVRKLLPLVRQVLAEAGLADRLYTERFRPSIVVTGEGGTVSFAKNGTTLEADGATPILDAAEEAWGDAVEVTPFNAAGDGMTALSSGTIDAMVMDVDQGVAASTVYFPDTHVVGTLPPVGEPEQLGLVLDKGSALTECVSQAVDTLDENGTLEELRAQWLKSDDIPELS